MKSFLEGGYIFSSEMGVAKGATYKKPPKKIKVVEVVSSSYTNGIEANTYSFFSVCTIRSSCDYIMKANIKDCFHII